MKAHIYASVKGREREEKERKKKKKRRHTFKIINLSLQQRKQKIYSWGNETMNHVHNLKSTLNSDKCQDEL